ncbi:response regulator [Geomesophilobacter sediminis]|uniref:Response regulator transcription factor n=1 Tax=Geomesophilobacter sediminis TaxID=2798584 RepID=A0A8J7IMF9_9BACT|nr:response regulator transcription factor [Geomesophilobacter sediminis]MBJ6723918.1 response regulator transcription factor [Geomesophilobacter sediminis]
MSKILVVDDHAVVRQGIISILERSLSRAFYCAEAGTAGEAEAKLSQEKYDVLLLDLSMPGMSGLDLLEKLHRERPELRILILSMHPEEQYAVRALSLGASGYLTKESAPAELVVAVNKVLAGGRYISSALADRLAEYLLSGKETGLPHEALSARERQVLVMIGAGKVPKQIGAELGISEKTVSTYRSRILSKLGLSSTTEIIRYAIKHDLIS